MPPFEKLLAALIKQDALSDDDVAHLDRWCNSGQADKIWEKVCSGGFKLRRTVETRLAGLRIPKEIRDRALNHVSGDIGSKHYNLHDYADEKREALNRWSLALAAILDPVAAPVIDLAEARKRGGAV